MMRRKAVTCVRRNLVNCNLVNIVTTGTQDGRCPIRTNQEHDAEWESHTPLEPRSGALRAWMQPACGPGTRPPPRQSRCKLPPTCP
eukprot:6657241-Prymnesium_polylepis.1